ncbi:unnamed protein product, partial [Prorocentrum cordatum]
APAGRGAAEGAQDCHGEAAETARGGGGAEAAPDEAAEVADGGGGPGLGMGLRPPLARSCSGGSSRERAASEGGAAQGPAGLGRPPDSGEAQAPAADRRAAGIWRPRRSKCAEETDEDPAWYKHKRHVLVFAYSGKPVYTRYGSEDGICKTAGALSAIVSKMATFFFASSSSPDSLKYMVAGERIFVFVEKGPLWLVCISRCGDVYPDVVKMLDRVHSQIVAILTRGIDRTLIANPNYDMRSLLGGTDCVVNSMIRWCTQDFYAHVDGFEPLPLAPASRNAAVEALRSAKVPNVLCGFLMASSRILAVVTNRQFKLNAVDLSMVVNMIMSSASLRSGESWTPVCLQHLSDKAFAYAYISFIEGADVGVVFLSSDNVGEQFYAISKQAANVKRVLQSSGCLDAVVEAMQQCPIDLRAGPGEDGARGQVPARRTALAPAPPGQFKLLGDIIHAAYFVPSLQQFFSSSIAPPYRSRRRAKMLFRCYGRCRLLLRNATKLPAQICIATDHECFYAYLAVDHQLYLAVPRGISTGVIGQFYQWMKSQEAHIFLGQIPCW